MLGEQVAGLVFPQASPDVPTVTAGEMRGMDRTLTEDVGLPLLSMMENAGRHLATLARARHHQARTVAVLAGKGGNGGGGLVAARYLDAAGPEVAVHLTHAPAECRAEVATHARLLEHTGITAATGAPEDGAAPDLVLDALLGYSQQGPPRGATAELVAWVLGQDAPVVSLDLPTGLDPDTGEAHEPGIRAEATLTLALPKPGLFSAQGRDRSGALYLADIGIPRAVYRRYGVHDPIFRQGPILQL